MSDKGTRWETRAWASLGLDGRDEPKAPGHLSRALEEEPPCQDRVDLIEGSFSWGPDMRR